MRIPLSGKLESKIDSEANVARNPGDTNFSVREQRLVAQNAALKAKLEAEKAARRADAVHARERIANVKARAQDQIARAKAKV